VKSIFSYALIAAGAGLAASCNNTAPEPPKPRPKLIVQITFDQLRGDLLERYRPAFTGGFKRVLDGGWWVRRGNAEHGLTVSFPGHATLATGMYPAHHGLTANEWWQEADGRWRPVSVVDDKRYAMTGDGTGVSPRQMTASSLADWVKAASPAAKASETEPATYLTATTPLTPRASTTARCLGKAVSARPKARLRHAEKLRKNTTTTSRAPKVSARARTVAGAPVSPTV